MLEWLIQFMPEAKYRATGNRQSGNEFVEYSELDQKANDYFQTIPEWSLHNFFYSNSLQSYFITFL